MSRTYRTIPNRSFRKPKTFSERKLINSLKNDPDLKEFGQNLPNRYNRWIPTSYDDLVISAWDEIYK